MHVNRNTLKTPQIPKNTQFLKKFKYKNNQKAVVHSVFILVGQYKS